MSAYFWKDSPRTPAKNAKNAKDAKNAKKVLRMLTIFEVQTHALDHEGLFYHIGRGKKRMGGGAPPRGVTIKNQLRILNTSYWEHNLSHVFVHFCILMHFNAF